MNGGDLAALGKEFFHAKLVHGSEGISIHVLAIASIEWVNRLKRDDQVSAFRLATNPEIGDAKDPLMNETRQFLHWQGGS